MTPDTTKSLRKTNKARQKTPSTKSTGQQGSEPVIQEILKDALEQADVSEHKRELVINAATQVIRLPYIPPSLLAEYQNHHPSFITDYFADVEAERRHRRRLQNKELRIAHDKAKADIAQTQWGLELQGQELDIIQHMSKSGIRILLLLVILGAAFTAMGHQTFGTICIAGGALPALIDQLTNILHKR